MTSLDTLGVSALFVAVTVVATVNPVERRGALAELRPTSRPVRACGAAIAFVVLAVLALAADPLLDALDVSAATARVAAGLVLLIRALLDVIGPSGDAPSSGEGEPSGARPPATTVGLTEATTAADRPPPTTGPVAAPGTSTAPDGTGNPGGPIIPATGWVRRLAAVARRGAVPVAFPVLFRPELTLVVVAFAGSDRLLACVSALAVGLVLFAALPPALASGRRGRALGRSTALIVTALAVALVVGGVLDL